MDLNDDSEVKAHRLTRMRTLNLDGGLLSAGGTS